MMKRLNLAMIVLATVAAFGCGGAATDTAAPAEEVVVDVAEAQPAADARHDQVYVCNCGPSCTCGTVAVEPGTCECGQELVQAHVVKIEGNMASLCTCGGDCTCTIDAEDPTKCGCGKDVRVVSLEGTGLYYCNCGGSCTCNFVSDEPGTCSCGMELTTS
jgi:hypothetical protein